MSSGRAGAGNTVQMFIEEMFGFFLYKIPIIEAEKRLEGKPWNCELPVGTDDIPMVRIQSHYLHRALSFSSHIKALPILLPLHSALLVPVLPLPLLKVLPMHYRGVVT